MNQTPTLGFIGMGLMGIPMSTRLAEAGFSINVWNRNPAKTAAPCKAGAHRVDSIQALVSQSDIVMLCVTDTAAVEDIVFQVDAVATHGSAGKVLVDFSSIDPDATRRFAERLQSACGMHWVDAPVSGGVAGAEAGTLAVMVGGDEKHIDSLRPILAPLSQRVTRMGPIGSGQCTKVCNQILVSCNLMVMAEVLALAEKAGVDARQIPSALKGGFADSTPLQLTGTRMAEKDFDEVKWHVKTLLKDLNMASDLASSLDAETPMAELGKTLMAKHNDQGFADQDPCTLIKMYSK